MGRGIQFILSLLFVLEVRSDGYGSGISKNTFANSDPHSCHAFFFKYLPVRCQDSFACNMSTPCMTSGRVALCNADSMISETTCSMPDGSGPPGGQTRGGGNGAFGGLLHGGQRGPPPGAGSNGGPSSGSNNPDDETNEENNEEDKPPSFFSGLFGGGGAGGPDGAGGDFGLHTVNASARPGHQELLTVEKTYELRFKRAVELNQYDVFMDFSTVFYATSLDRYITEFLEDNVPFVVVRWRDDGGNHMHSLIVKACGQVILELVSISPPKVDFGKAFIEDTIVRLPTSLFAANDVYKADRRVLVPLAISKGTSEVSLPESIEFYTQILEATQVHEDSDYSEAGTTHVSTYRLANAEMVIRFIYRADTLGTIITPTSEEEVESDGKEEEDTTDDAVDGDEDTDVESDKNESEQTTDSESSADDAVDGGDSGDGSMRRKLVVDGEVVLSVRDMESMKKAVRDAFWQDKYCGVDKFIDNHFAWDQFDIDLTEKAAIFDEKGIKYHIFGDGISRLTRGAPTNMYVVDPTGDSIQMDGPWSETPTGGAGDSLQDACSQGNCCDKGNLAATMKPTKKNEEPEYGGNCSLALFELSGHFMIENELGEVAQEARVACIDRAYSFQGRAILQESQCEPADAYLYCMDTEDICNPSIFQRIKNLVQNHLFIVMFIIIGCFWFCGCSFIYIIMNLLSLSICCKVKPKPIASAQDLDDNDEKEEDDGRHTLNDFNPEEGRGGDVELTTTNSHKLSTSRPVSAAKDAFSAMSNRLGIDEHQEIQQGAYTQVNMNVYGGDDVDDEDQF